MDFCQLLSGLDYSLMYASGNFFQRLSRSLHDEQEHFGITRSKGLLQAHIKPGLQCLQHGQKYTYLYVYVYIYIYVCICYICTS